MNKRNFSPLEHQSVLGQDKQRMFNQQPYFVAIF